MERLGKEKEKENWTQVCVCVDGTDWNGHDTRDLQNNLNVWRRQFDARVSD